MDRRGKEIAKGDQILIFVLQVGTFRPDFLYNNRMIPFLDKTIRTEIDLPVGIDAAWEAWTTPAGVRTFFAPGCNIDVRVGGLYEIYFDPEAPSGQRGSEGMRILALQVGHMLSFEWNAPPELAEIRGQRTHVTVRFCELSKIETRVIITHDGWGEGKLWDEAFNYFARAWGVIVLPRLRHSFLVGPIDWHHPPELGEPQ